jgi:hypothetical protein
VLLQAAEPAKMSFLYISTNVFGGQVPLIVTGDVLKRCWLVGEVIVAPVLGGLPGMLPVKLTDSA